jgi:hypothetical protein
MTTWSSTGQPAPNLSLLFIHMFVAAHGLVTIFFTIIVTFIVRDDYLLVISAIVSSIISYFLRMIYLRLFFNFFIWLLKRNGKSLFDRVSLRTLKYSVLMFGFLPLILLITQGFLEMPSIAGQFRFFAIFKYYYLSLGLIILIAYLVEKYLPNKIYRKVDQVYSQTGGLMAMIEW